jgi:hypothetical protein
VLYGFPTFPTYSGGNWIIAPPKMGIPLYGAPGFGNMFNSYTWSMAVYQKKLYVGTFDYSYLILDEFLQYSLPGLVSPDVAEALLKVADKFMFGADIWTFNGGDSPAIPSSLDGLGNPLNYGIRNMLSDESAGLYFGTGKIRL